MPERFGSAHPWRPPQARLCAKWRPPPCPRCPIRRGSIVSRDKRNTIAVGPQLQVKGTTSPSANRGNGPELSKLLPRTGRRVGWWWVRSLSLAQRLLVGAIFVVGIGMLTLGYWTTRYIEDGITQGVASTAAASIDSLISWQLETLNPERPLSPDDVERLNAVRYLMENISTGKFVEACTTLNADSIFC